MVKKNFRMGLPPLPDLDELVPLPSLLITEDDIKTKTADQISEMIDRGTDPNIGGPLTIAIHKYNESINQTNKRRYMDIINLLIRRSDINQTTLQRRETPLMKSIETPSLFGFLLRRNPDVTIADWKGKTVLFHILERGSVDVLRQLLDHINRDLINHLFNLKDVDGEDALSYCVNVKYTNRDAPDSMEKLNILLPIFKEVKIQNCLNSLKGYHEMLMNYPTLPKDVVNQIVGYISCDYTESFERAIENAQYSMNYMRDVRKSLRQEVGRDDRIWGDIIQLLVSEEERLCNIITHTPINMIGKKKKVHKKKSVRKSGKKKSSRKMKK